VFVILNNKTELMVVEEKKKRIGAYDKRIIKFHDPYFIYII
jgi:hypothetical protein